MRNFKILVLTLLLAVGSSTPLFARGEPSYESWTNKSQNVGRESTPVRILKLVRYASRDAAVASAGIVSGDAVKYDLVSDDGVTVAWSFANSGDSAFAGIAVTAIATPDSASSSALDDIGKRNWGWIIVHGPAIANVTAGGTNGNSAGDPFIMSTDNGKVTGWAANTITDANKVAKSRQGGFFYDAADGTSTSVEVFVQNE